MLVIGDDVEEQLAPYNEELHIKEEIERCGPVAEAMESLLEQRSGEYWEKHPKTFGSDEFKQAEIKRSRDVAMAVNPADEDAVMRWYHGSDIRKDAQGWYHQYWTNPDAHWDWYQIGGRWSGRILRVKPGVQVRLGEYSPFDASSPASHYTDVCAAGEVDWDAMRQDATDRAWEQWHAARRVLDAHPRVRPWDVIMAGHCPDGNLEHINDARQEYQAQPGVIAYQSAALEPGADLDLWDGPDIYLCTESQFLDRARAAAGRTFAVVMDGKWYQRGRMGWWGVVTDDKPEEEWSVEHTKLIDGLTPDTKLTVVDCHI